MLESIPNTTGITGDEFRKWAERVWHEANPDAKDATLKVIHTPTLDRAKGDRVIRWYMVFLASAEGYSTKHVTANSDGKEITVR